MRIECGTSGIWTCFRSLLYVEADRQDGAGFVHQLWHCQGTRRPALVRKMNRMVLLSRLTFLFWRMVNRVRRWLRNLLDFKQYGKWRYGASMVVVYASF